MRKFQGPWYSLQEASEMLKLRESELRHLIRCEELLPVLYAKPRAMLVVRWDPDTDGKWIGHGTCSYRGHFFVHPNSIRPLLDGETISLRRRVGRLLQVEEISDFSANYPFQKPLPHGPFSKWEGQDLSPTDVAELFATPLPKEFEPGKKIVGRYTQYLAAAFDKQKNPESGVVGATNLLQADANDLELDFESNSKFELLDLRIAASEITTYQQRAALSSSVPATGLDSSIKSPNLRENQFHTLVKRILKVKPEISAKEAWHALKEDSRRDEPLYDTDHILQIVDDVCIEWRSRHGAGSAMTWKSFQPLLSKLKKSL